MPEDRVRAEKGRLSRVSENRRDGQVGDKRAKGYNMGVIYLKKGRQTADGIIDSKFTARSKCKVY